MDGILLDSAGRHLNERAGKDDVRELRMRRAESNAGGGRQPEPEDPENTPESKPLIVRLKDDVSTAEATKEKVEVERLKMAQKQIEAHELAHRAVGGQYAGPMTFKTVKGPDGKIYRVHGEVSIDISDGRTPEETVRKMQQIRRAAMAPLSPSPQDRIVAGYAATKERQARQEIAEERDLEAESEQEPVTYQFDWGHIENTQPKIKYLNALGIRIAYYA